MNGDSGSLKTYNVIEHITKFTGSSYSLDQINCRIIDEHDGDTVITLPSNAETGKTFWVYKSIDNGWTQVKTSGGSLIKKLKYGDGWVQIVKYYSEWF